MDFLIERVCALEQNLDPLVSLLAETFGLRDGMHNSVQKWVSEEQTSVLIAKSQNTIAAISIAQILRSNNSELDELSKIFETQVATNGKWGSFRTLAVLPRYRRAGMGEKLSVEQLRWMKLQGCSGALGISWENGTEDSSVHLFKKAGFERLGSSNAFYLEGSRRSHHRCPVCRGECHCVATLYQLKWGLLG